jgi:hypothetical protein
MDFVHADSGEAQLLRHLNHLQSQIDLQRVATGKLELGMKELSHLHAQLNAITLQCTIIVGFALTNIGADTLSQLASDVDQFCMYKTVRSILYTYLFLGFTLLSIFSCMTIIACAQKVQRACVLCGTLRAPGPILSERLCDAARAPGSVCAVSDHGGEQPVHDV